MASGFSGGGGGSDFYSTGNGRSAMSMNNHPQQNPYRAALAGILPEAPSQMMQNRGQDLIGKRSLAEFQREQLQIQHQQQQQQQQMVGMGLGGLFSNLRNVKPRMNYQHSSPISPLSPVDLSSLSSSSSELSGPSLPMNARYGIPILQHQLRQQQQLQQRNNGMMMMGNTPNRFGSNVSGYNRFTSFPNLAQNQRPVVMGGNEIFSPQPSAAVEDQTTSDKKMLNKLQELEKQLLLDDDDFGSGGAGSDDAVSVVTGSEWSETIQNLDLIASSGGQNMTVGNGNGNNANNNANVVNSNGISPSPTSSSSSCSSTSASPPLITTPRQSIAEVAAAVSEGRMEAASEILTRLAQVSNVKGTSEQRLTAYMTSALRSRVNPTEYPPPVSELYNKDHSLSTQMLYEVSPCFKLGFMAANLAILEAVSEAEELKLHVIDFDIGQGGQYVHLLHALAAKKQAQKPPAVLKITTFADFGGEDRLKAVGDTLMSLANKLGVRLYFNMTSLSISDLSREKIGVEADESLAVNFAFRLYKLPDESVTTENLRDELLRQVKGLTPKIVTLVEQEMNANTAAFGSRVNEACGYYGVLFDSLDATMPREFPERVKIEEGLGRKLANSVACEGRDRVERCEVFGKWRARMGMAGFEPKAMSQFVADSLRSKLNTGQRGNPGFTVNEQSGGICFGWMGRTLTVASAWR